MNFLDYSDIFLCYVMKHNQKEIEPHSWKKNHMLSNSSWIMGLAFNLTLSAILVIGKKRERNSKIEGPLMQKSQQSDDHHEPVLLKPIL